MAESTDFTDLLSAACIAKVRTFFEGKVTDIDRFVSAYIKTQPSGQAQFLNPARRDENIQFMRRLIELFSRIDTYGNGSISWDQFTTFAAENTLSAGPDGGKAKASVIFRDNGKFLVPLDQDLPLTRVTCMKWVPELQQLFVTHQNYPTLFVFNHLCRMIARLHANMPPADSAPSTSKTLSTKARGEMSSLHRGTLNMRDAMETSKFDTLTWGDSFATGGGGRRRGGEDGDSADGTGEPEGPEGEGQGQGGGVEEGEGEKSPKVDSEVSWALGVLKSRSNLGPGQRMKAAQVLANARCLAESRKAALLAELGVSLHKDSSALSLNQQRAVDAEVKATLSETKMGLRRPATANASLHSPVKPNSKLVEMVHEVVEQRGAEASFRRGYAIERASAQAVLLGHPAGFASSAVERLKNMTLSDLGEAAATVLPMLGVKNAGSANWKRAGTLFRQGTGAEKAKIAVEDDKPKKDSRTVAEVTGGKPQTQASAAMIAFDPGPNGRIHDFGYPVSQDAKFSKPKAKNASTSAELAEEGGETAVRTRIDLLALAKGNESAEVTLLGVEYCMPVDKKFGLDPKAWRGIRPTDVRHILAVSSSELIITLWHTRTLVYSGVIHVLLPQDRLTWSTGSNLLLSCNSFVGPVTGWDVLSGSKVCSLDAHTAAIMAVIDISSLGIIVTGSMDCTIKVWGYRSESENMGGELAGVRGRVPPRKPTLVNNMIGHTSGVLNLAATDDPMTAKLISTALGSEVIIWDLLHRVMLQRVGTPGRDTSINALALTATTPPYAMTIDEGNTIRMWTIDSASATILEQVDAYKLGDLPYSSINAIAIPAPHPHIVLGGRQMLLMGPASPTGDPSEGTADSPGSGAIPSSALYSPEMACMMIAEGNNVMVWDSRTGKWRRKLANVLPQMLVSMVMDGTQRKVLVGDAGGDLAIVNILDGRVLSRAVNAHTDDVTRICVLAEDQVAVTCSWDRSIRVWDMSRENGAKEGSLPVCRLVQNAHGADITAMDVSRGLGLCATGAADGTLRVWDFCSFDLNAELVGHTHGITALAFAGPGIMPLLVSTDDGGFIYIWAVRGSNYTDRLVLGLRNLGSAGGPPAPPLRVVDLASLKAESARKRAVVVKAGVVSVKTVKMEDKEHLKDEGLKALFNAKQVGHASAARFQAMQDVLAHTTDQQKLAARDVVNLAGTLSRSGGALDRLAGHSGEEPDEEFEEDEGSGGSPVRSGSSPSRSPRSPRSMSPNKSPKKLHGLTSVDDSVPVPISALTVYCRPVRKGAWDDPECKTLDCHTPVAFKLFTGDGQGMLKQWDLSAHVNRFCSGGHTGIGLLPSIKYAFNAISWCPRSIKHRVYPDEGPVAYDPEQEAKAASLADALRRMGPSRGRNNRVISPDAERMASVLALLRSRRTMYSALHPIIPQPRTFTPLGQWTPGLEVLEHQLAVAQAASDAAEEKKRKEEHDAEVEEAKARLSAAAAKVAEEAATAYAKAHGHGLDRPGTASSRNGTGHASRPPSASLHAGKPLPVGVGGAAMLASSASTSHSHSVPDAAKTHSHGPLADGGSRKASTASSLQDGVLPFQQPRSGPPEVEKGRSLVYPQVKPLFGAIVYDRVLTHVRHSPLIPTLVRPSPHVPRSIVAYSDGLDLADEDLHHHHTSSKFSMSKLPTGLALATGVAAVEAGSDILSSEKGFSGFAHVPSARSSPPRMLCDELSQSVQDDLWYTFTCTLLEYESRKGEFRDLAEREAGMRGWENHLEKGKEVASGDAAGSSSSSSATSIVTRRGIGSKAVVAAKSFHVPDTAWVASRLRLDIRPVCMWTGHTDLITSLAFVPDPVTLLSTSMDGSTRLWTPNGLPIGVVSAPVVNKQLEAAMAAAAKIAKSAGGEDSDKGSEKPFGTKQVKNLSKEECSWQFVPNDEEKVLRTTRAATAVLGRLTTFKPNRRASVQLTEHVRVNAADALAASSNSTNINSVLSTVYNMGRRASTAAAEAETHTNKFLLAAKAATIAAEAIAHAPGAAAHTRNIAGGGLIGGGGGRAPSEEEAEAAADAASRVLNAALINAIGTWDDGSSGPGQSIGVGRGASSLFTSPLRVEGLEAHGRSATDEDMMRRYGHMAAEVKRQALEAKDSDPKYKGLPLKDMRDLGLVPGGGHERPISAAGRPHIPPVGAPASQPVSWPQSRPGTAPPATAPATGPSAGAGGRRGSEYVKKVVVWVPPPVEPEMVNMPRRGGLSGLQSAQKAAEEARSKALVEHADNQEGEWILQAKERAKDKAAAEAAKAADVAKAARRGSTRPASASGLGRAPPSGGAGSMSSPLRPSTAHLTSLVSKLRVSTAAAAAGFDLEQKLGVVDSDSLPVPLPEGGEGMAVAGVRLFKSRPATGRAEGKDERHGHGSIEDGKEREEGDARSAAPPSDRQRLDTLLSRVSTLLSVPPNSHPTVRPHVRAKADDLMAAAQLMHEAGEEKKAETARPRGSPSRPSTALPRLMSASGALTQLMNNSATLRAVQLEEIPDLDVFGPRPGTAGAASATTGGRPGTAASARRTLTGRADRSASPDRRPTTVRPPTGISSWEAIMWPFRDYTPPRAFGMYSRPAVEAFRAVWAQLDADASGQVDIEELLNAKLFPTSTLKVTKALFGTIDEDKSGTVSLKEMLRVAFPLVDGDGRHAIAKFIRFCVAKEQAEGEKLKAAMDSIGEDSTGGGGANVASLKASLKRGSTSEGASSAPVSGGPVPLGLDPDAKGRPRPPSSSAKAGAALQAMARSRESRHTAKSQRESKGDDEEDA